MYLTVKVSKECRKMHLSHFSFRRATAHISSKQIGKHAYACVCASLCACAHTRFNGSKIKLCLLHSRSSSVFPGEHHWPHDGCWYMSFLLMAALVSIESICHPLCNPLHNHGCLGCLLKAVWVYILSSCLVICSGPIPGGKECLSAGPCVLELQFLLLSWPGVWLPQFTVLPAATFEGLPTWYM